MFFPHRKQERISTIKDFTIWRQQENTRHSKHVNVKYQEIPGMRGPHGFVLRRLRVLVVFFFFFEEFLQKQMLSHFVRGLRLRHADCTWGMLVHLALGDTGQSTSDMTTVRSVNDGENWRLWESEGQKHRRLYLGFRAPEFMSCPLSSQFLVVWEPCVSIFIEKIRKNYPMRDWYQWPHHYFGGLGGYSDDNDGGSSLLFHCLGRVRHGGIVSHTVLLRPSSKTTQQNT